MVRKIKFIRNKVELDKYLEDHGLNNEEDSIVDKWLFNLEFSRCYVGLKGFQVVFLTRKEAINYTLSIGGDELRLKDGVAEYRESPNHNWQIGVSLLN